MFHNVIRYFLENRLVTLLLLIIIVAGGLITSPFSNSWRPGFLPADPVSVDAIPNLGENQQIVFTEWKGRSPQDIEDQITYPLTSALLGIPGVNSIRSSSVFGFSSIYIIFEEEVEFYWSRSRILEKLNAIPSGFLPDNVQPTLGPDATALGQVFWYTLEGRAENGEVTGGWDLHEIRTIQDYYIKYGLNAVEGVSEVASIGGYVQEYHVDVNPDALKAFDVDLSDVISAVRKSNKDVGSKTIEINRAEYLIRGIGSVESKEDIESAVVASNDNIPVLIKDVAVVSVGPASRRGVLDKGGAEVVGGVVVARYGANPMEVINHVKDKIKEISLGLPKKVLADGRISQLTIVPFYDRSELINETIGTLEEALTLELLITIIVVIILVLNLRASVLIAGMLPIAILIVFIAMRYLHVEANIVALSGIAIAIGTMIDLGIILTENIVKHFEAADSDKPLSAVIFEATAEVSNAILTAVATTIISFVPVFTLQAAEGKLFSPLAFTKTFALLAALIVTLLVLPAAAHWLFGIDKLKLRIKKLLNVLLILIGFFVAIRLSLLPGLLTVVLGTIWLLSPNLSKNKYLLQLPVMITVVFVVGMLTNFWMPLGVGNSFFSNFSFISIILLLIIGFFFLLEKFYSQILDWCLSNRRVFMTIPILLLFISANIWLGFPTVFRWVSAPMEKLGINVEDQSLWTYFSEKFPGMGREFMPALDEGSFLLMPSAMPHAGIAESTKRLQQLDIILENIPEVEQVVGKLGRVESALDPAPISMYENVISYKTEYIQDEKGKKKRFKVDSNDKFILTSGEKLASEEAINRNISENELIPDPYGNYYRNWREAINSPDDIWNEIVRLSKVPGVTSAPKLQPIETRLLMLQTGMRSPMGIKVYGPDLETIQNFGYELEKNLKNVGAVKASSVFADRIVGKPYLELQINRDAIARYGINVQDVQNSIETAIGGDQVSVVIDGRKRYPVRVRYPRELRNDPEALSKILVSTPKGAQIPLGDLVDIEFQKGPQVIKSEETFLVGYVLFDKNEGVAETDVVELAKEYLDKQIAGGRLVIPEGISYKFSGSYENQQRAEKRLSLILPLVLIIILIILYMQFKSLATSLIVFAGVALAFSGGFITLWLYGMNGFMDFSLFGINMRTLFQIDTINLSVAVWVGFIALFGIATDDGVLIATYLDQSISKLKPKNKPELTEAVIMAGKKRIKPAIMTTVTTLIALLPVLTSTGKGSDIMIPMAIPAFGGMLVASVTYFFVPVLYSIKEELKLKKQLK